MAEQDAQAHIPATPADKELVLRILRRNHRYYAFGIRGTYVVAVAFAVVILIAALSESGGGLSPLDAASALIVLVLLPIYRGFDASTVQALEAVEALGRRGGRFPHDLPPDARQTVDKTIPRPKNLLFVVIVLAWAAAFILGLVAFLLWEMGDYLMTEGDLMLWLVVAFVLAAGLAFLLMFVQQAQLYRDVKRRPA